MDEGRMTDLSVLIPARNEMFLAHTVQDILEHIEADTEIIVAIDGGKAGPAVPEHERVRVLEFPESIGQRAATNRVAEIAKGEYLLKCDGHCAFDQGFDRKLLEVIQPSWTMVPVMRNLHAFDWVCKNGHRRYQGPSGPCAECGEPTEMDIVWIPKTNPQSTSYCFDSEPHFQYFNEYKERPEFTEALANGLTETMSLQGSCFMLTREKYFDLNICDEEFGSWGSQGIEVAVKTWLSGGRVVVNHNTWYAHLFRTQGGDFSFPYPISGKQVSRAKKQARDLFFENKWPKQIYPLSWLVEKFWPVKGWTDEDLAKLNPNGKNSNVGVLYYTDNCLDPQIMQACQEQLKKSGLPIVSVSLKPLDFGKNIVLPLERGYLSMFKQILAGLEALDCDYVFFAEHDVLYHPSHFEFVPERNKYYYNTNVWKVRVDDGHALHYDCQQTSGLCAYRDTLIKHYRERVRRTEEKWKELGDTREFRNWIRKQGFEPGTHNRTERVDDLKAESWQSQGPNIDIRHNGNLTGSRWKKEEFRNQKYTAGWTEAESISGWYEMGKFGELLNG
jgi:hypothetical protein